MSDNYSIQKICYKMKVMMTEKDVEEVWPEGATCLLIGKKRYSSKS